MKKIHEWVIPPLLLALGFAGCTQDPTIAHKEVPKQETPQEANKFSGTHQQFNDQFVFRNGKLHTMLPYSGDVVILGDNAAPLSKETYVNGKLDGPSTRWWGDTGVKKMLMTYSHGTPSGTKNEWYPDGGRKLEQHLINGISSGKETAWYPSGQMQYTREFIDGKPSGVWSEWDKDGKLTRSLRYKNGQVAELLHPK